MGRAAPSHLSESYTVKCVCASSCEPLSMFPRLEESGMKNYDFLPFAPLTGKQVSLPVLKVLTKSHNQWRRDHTANNSTNTVCSAVPGPLRWATSKSTRNYHYNEHCL